MLFLAAGQRTAHGSMTLVSGLQPLHGQTENRIICGNDPVNRHDPLGLVDPNTLAALGQCDEERAADFLSSQTVARARFGYGFDAAENIRRYNSEALSVNPNAKTMTMIGGQILQVEHDPMIGPLYHGWDYGKGMPQGVSLVPTRAGGPLIHEEAIIGLDLNVLAVMPLFKTLTAAPVITRGLTATAIRPSSGGAAFDAAGQLMRNGARPLQSQIATNTCGPTAVGMTLDTTTAARTSTKLFNLQLSAQGTTIDRLAKLLNVNGVSATWRAGFNIEQLALATSRGRPAIAHVGIPGGGGHFVVVDGVTTRIGQRVVAIRDPAGGRQYFELVSEFLKRFSGQVVTLP
jgi:hypothetical protein